MSSHTDMYGQAQIVAQLFLTKLKDMDATFKEIAESLQCGREIEFSYHNKIYSITNSCGYWNFCCGNELIEKVCPFNDKKTLVQRVASYCIDNTPIPRIFDENKYDQNSVLIL